MLVITLYARALTRKGQQTPRNMARTIQSGNELDVHASRLKFYCNDKFNTTEEILEQVAAQCIILPINEFKQHRWNSSINDYEVLESWTGLESIEDS
ncbi:Hypothetical protein PHPALM_9058 [Phytophthora palmivora]|uniref:Uncharacterized protein n=1 Tax=Phytophthora palmivora TaxID=4796 RepID=A0A2P4Y8A2_9STRA|nr:Hypothetical protein PHPALM_9058 [Phytophthora palmivora]